MNPRFNPRAAVLGLALVSVALPAIALAQAAPSEVTLKAMKDLNGNWNRVEPAPGATPPAPPPPPQPGAPISTVNDRRFPPDLLNKLTPGPKAAFLKFKDLAGKVIDTEPPTPDNNCLPFAMAGETVVTGWIGGIYVTPTVIGIHHQIDNQLRLVHMNVEHPKDLKPSMHGHSVGHWEGDTLVIDTIGYDPRAQFNDGYTHGPNLHSVERYRVIDGKILEKTFTFTDPDSLTEPYTIVRRQQKTDKPFQEYLNAQNNTLYECPTAEKGSAYKPVM